MPFNVVVVLLLVIAVGVIIVVVLGNSVGGCSVPAEIVIIIIAGR